MKPTRRVPILFILMALCVMPVSAGDDDIDGIEDLHEQALLDKYAPIVKLHSGDSLRPANVDWVLPFARMRYNHNNCPDHPLLNYGQVTEFNITDQTHQDNSSFCSHSGPTRHSDVDEPPENLSSGFFLQFLESTREGSSSGGWTVYGHVYPGAGNRKVLQYWFFYPYNHAFGTFNHEGDWEFMAVVLDTQEQAESYILAAHGDPHTFSATTNPAQVQTEGNHPIIYSAKGSHASYPSYTGDVCDGSPNIGLTPMDRCDSSGPEWRTWELGFGGVVNLGERAFPNFNWLNYTGLWGEVGAWPEIPIFRHTTGPRGPAYQRQSWHIVGTREVCGNGIDDDVDGAVDEFPCSEYKPDLAMTESNPAIAPDGHGGWITIDPGETFPVRCGLDNLGAEITDTFDVEFALSLDRQRSPDDIPMTGCLNLPGMPARTSYASIPTWDVTVPSSTPPGVYWVIATADASHVVDEGIDGEGNNERASQMQVTVRGQSGQFAMAASPIAEEITDNFSDFAAQDFDPDKGTWDASSGSYVGKALSVDRNDTVSLVSTTATGVVIDVDFSIHEEGSSGSYLGVVLRYENPSNFVRVDIRRVGSSSRMRLLQVESGATQELASVTLPRGIAAGLHHLKITDSGCDVTVKLNHELFIDVAYTSIIPSNQRGLYVNKGSTVMFDNFHLIGNAGADMDGDGWLACAGDCNDTSDVIHPGRSESCSTADDDDCDGQVNEGCRQTGCRKNCPNVAEAQ